MAGQSQPQHIERIKLFLTSCHEDKPLETLKIFRDKKSEKQPTLVDEINQTINAFKTSSLIGKSDLTNKRNEIRKIADKLLNGKRKGPSSHPKACDSNENRINSKEPSNYMQSQGLTGFKQKLKNKQENIGPAVINPLIEGGNWTTGNADSFEVNSQQPYASGNSYSKFNQKLKQKANGNITDDGDGQMSNAGSDFYGHTQQSQIIPSLFGPVNFPSSNLSGPTENNPNIPSLLDPINVPNDNSNSRGRGRNQRGRERGRRRSRGRGLQQNAFNGSVGSLPDLVGQNRSMRNSNFSEADSTVSENPNFRGRRNQVITRRSICPLCFENFPAMRELAIHLKARCAVVYGDYNEPKGLSLFQIFDNMVKCNVCKLEMVDNWVDKHKQDEHINDPRIDNLLVNLAFCVTCSDLVPTDAIEYHRGTICHKGMTELRVTHPVNRVVLLRCNTYCMLCKVYQPARVTFEQHLNANSHVKKDDGTRCEVWCYYCKSNVPAGNSNIIDHLKGRSHTEKSSRKFYCQFCRSEFKLPGFLGHIQDCINQNNR